MFFPKYSIIAFGFFLPSVLIVGFSKKLAFALSLTRLSLRTGVTSLRVSDLFLYFSFCFIIWLYRITACFSIVLSIVLYDLNKSFFSCFWPRPNFFSGFLFIYIVLIYLWGSSFLRLLSLSLIDPILDFSS